MSFNSAAPPQPDPAIGQAASKQAELGEQWLAFAKEQFKVSNERQTELDELTKRVTEQQLEIADRQDSWAQDDRARYEDTFRPIEDEFIAEAGKYGSPERQAEAAAQAKADVMRATADAEAAAKREAASMGIDPTSGRYAGIDRAAGLTRSLATAGAQNNARTLEREKGLALKADIANLGRGLPAQSAQAASLGMSSGASAIGLNQANQNLFNSSTGIVGQGYGGAMGGYGNQAATLQGQHNAALSAWDAAEQRNSDNMMALGSALGTGAGMIFSSEDLKEDKADIPDGEALEAVKDLDVEAWKYKDGVADEGRHVGPYAEDFQRETGSGDGTTIPLQDAVGLTMKAVQDLDAKIDRLSTAAGLAPPAASSGRRRKKAPMAMKEAA